ncbi:MAG: hypothetical protein NTV54_10800 [Ignavibacteriales bacterium]|nr:hypothetical protein [Ignavibacteriales bacterium]
MRSFLILAGFVFTVTTSAAAKPPDILESLGITVSDSTRQFCFTNKQAGTYYGEVNARITGGWHGWFVNAQKILHDYDAGWNRRHATTTVYPHQIVRQYYDGDLETFTMLDSLDALVVDLTPARDANIVFTLQPTQDFTLPSVTTSTALFVGRQKTAATAATPAWLGCAAESSIVRNGALVIRGRRGHTSRIVIAAGQSTVETQHLIDIVLASGDALIASRAARMERLLAASSLKISNPDVNKAVQWAKLSLDALIMNQTVDGVRTKGIFAGLPWFNNYWGRDSFISLPGATYILGNFDDARKILLSYAQFQDTIPSSTTYGRIPNLATPTSVSYNTADGTPRFVMALHEYVRYSGDTTLLSALYPVVKRSIEGTLRYHTDALRFLTHGDAESWMDAVGTTGPWSPRGNRANDVQAIWYRQLKSGAAIALYNRDTVAARRWADLADTVKARFYPFFADPATGLLYDHLRANGEPAKELRPNQLFCLDMIEKTDVQRRILQSVTSHIVYEHGVGTLAQSDSNFHPFHYYEPAYVQDAAYHTGIVWTWLNGEAIIALCRHAACETAARLTMNMVHQILERGCVGTLSELLDAYPRPGEKEPRLSGTYSQAWSLAEFIRSIYQAYLGIEVNGNAVRLSPQLPVAFGDAEFTVHAGTASVRVRYEARGDSIFLSHDPSSLAISAPRAMYRSTNVSSAQFPLAQKVDDINIPSLRGPSYPILPLSSVRVKNSSAKILFDMKDPMGDDRGAADSYVYPTNVHFAPGILDITRAIVRYDAKNVYFSLRFKNLANPGWHPEYGYQLTFSAIAIHRGTSSATTAVGLNSGMVVPKDYAFDRLIAVGGGIRVTDGSGSVLCEYLPRPEDTADPIGSVKDKSVEFSLPIKYLGTPGKQWKLTILVGAQDDHGGGGVGEFRTIDAVGSEWTGGGKTDSRQSNVFDMLRLK